jgi:hypothetical protein
MSSDHHTTRGRPVRLNGRWVAGGLEDELDDDGFYAGRPVRAGRPIPRDSDGGGKLARRRPQRRDKRSEDPGL